MAKVTLTYPTFASGTVAVGSQVIDNFNKILNEFNGSISNANVASNAAIADTKLATISTAGKVSATALPSSITGLANGAVEFLIGDGVNVTSTGISAECYFPFAATITGVYLTNTKETGSIVCDVWKDSTANYPPTIADTLISGGIGGTKPTLSSARAYSDTTLTGWTKTITAGDYLIINIDSASLTTQSTLVITFTRT